MTSTELKDLESRLWQSADMLRAGAHLAANKYSQPILGLIFLRYADVLFKQHKEEIDAAYNEYKGTRMERSYKNIAIESVASSCLNVLILITSMMLPTMPKRRCW